jgi:hypothetical protein
LLSCILKVKSSSSILSGMVWDTILCRRASYSFSLDKRL